MNAKMLSDAIRMKRKSLKKDGVENMVDTAAGPQMNPQDILLNKQEAQWQDTMDTPEKSMAPDDPADDSIEGTSQDKGKLERDMAMIAKILHKLSVG